ncbi:MAG: hypothetical protein ACRESS_08085 [Stenotrophobium sp.]
MSSNRLSALIVRDGLLIAATAALWMYTLNLGTALGVWPVTLNILTGLMTVLIGYLLHEWGHLIGAWFSGSAVHLPQGALSSPFLFRFDTGLNNRRQFLAMSAGGFIASAAVVVALLLALPAGRLASHVALVLTLLGVLATFVLEIPPAWKVFRGGAMPGGSAFVSSPGDTRP